MKKSLEAHANARSHEVVIKHKNAYVPPAIVDMPGISEVTASGIVMLPIEIQGIQGPS